ncbi:hypothetical protein OM333_24285, partial [Escherichia albertii]|nr:hypothetical protein [Escherichia albertii]
GSVMAESGYGLAGRGWDWQNLSISTGLRRASAVLLQYHMKQLSTALHAADAAFRKHPPRPSIGIKTPKRLKNTTKRIFLQHSLCTI